jgi:hypothetical protein
MRLPVVSNPLIRIASYFSNIAQSTHFRDYYAARPHHLCRRSTTLRRRAMAEPAAEDADLVATLRYPALQGTIFTASRGNFTFSS